MTSEEYLAMLENSRLKFMEFFDNSSTRLAFIGEQIFDFTTYDDEISEIFAKRAIEVCVAISEKITFEYIKQKDNYQWYLLMCNMPFFSERLEWGTSIRGAWWSHSKNHFIESCGLFDGDEQVCRLDMTPDDWYEFISALVTFSRIDDTRWNITEKGKAMLRGEE